MAGTLFTYGADATGTAAFFAGFDTIAYSPLDLASPVKLRLSAAGTLDLKAQLAGRSVTFTAAPTGSNAVTTSDGDDTIIGGLDADILKGGAGNDTIFSAPVGSDDTANDTLAGGSGNNTLIDFGGATTNMSGLTGIDTFRLGGPQVLVGPSISGTIDGGGGNMDRIEAVASGPSGFVAPLRLQNLNILHVEILDASAGVIATAFQYESFKTIENAAGHTLTLAARGSVDLRLKLRNQGVVFVGSDSDDQIVLGNGADRIEGRGGNDSLGGLAGADQLYGGSGNDGANYLSSPESVFVDLFSGVGHGGHAEGDVYDSIESVSGSSFDDVFIASAAANSFFGGGGSDTVSYEKSTAGVTVNIPGYGSGGFAEGDSYNWMQNIIGSIYGDVLTGSSGNNVIRAAPEDLGNPYETDIVRAGDGNDTIWVNGFHPVESEYYGEGGNDTFDVPTAWLDSPDDPDGSVTVSGGSGKDKFYTVDRAYGTLDGGDDVDDLYIETDDSKAPHGQYKLQISNIENLYTRGDAASFTAAQFESFDRIAYSPTELSRRVTLLVRSEDGTSVDLSDELKGRSATVRLAVAMTSGRTSDGDDILSGGTNATYDAGAGKDEITGSTGADTLIGGAGADKLNGGDGIDTASFAMSAAAVRADLTALIGTGGDAGGDTYSGIENLIGSLNADTLIGSSAKNRIEGGKGDDVLAGRGGADTLIGGDGIDTVSYGTSAAAVRVDLINRVGTGGDAQGDTYSSIEAIRGSAFADTLIGSSLDNRIEGGEGDDILSGRAGADTLIGGGGVDTTVYWASLAAVRVDLTSLVGTGGDAAGDTYSSIENVRGSTLSDTLIGSSAKNRLEGGDGDDILAGRGGADTLIGDYGLDTVSYGTSAAAVRVDLTLLIGTGGDAAGDTYSSIENITGSSLADRLIGSEEANRIEGGLGSDTLTGQDGSDRFAFTTAPSASNIDVITDFTFGSDLISLSTAIYSALQRGPTPGSLAASSFRLATQSSSSGGLGEVIYNATTGSLLYDADGAGAGAAKQFASVSAGLALSASAFRLA